jgi:hypothetical protein
MSAEPIVSSKTCTVCGIDCSGRARVKDQQGRYVCKDCFDKVKQTKQALRNPPAPAAGSVAANEAASAATDGDNSFLLDMGSKESTGIAGTKGCPECGRAIPANAVICIGCGYNLTSGKRIPVKVIKAPKGKKSDDGGVASGAVGLGSSAVFCVVGGLIGGSIGAAIWAAIAYFTQYEIGYVAWAVGGLAGAGCSVGARGYAGVTSGGFAAVIAVVAVLAGKFIAGSLILQSMGLGNAPVDVWFPKLFGIFDVLWFLLAIATAFKVGSTEFGSGGD